MWQETAIIIIGILVLLYVGFKIYRFTTKVKDGDNPCAGCSGCDLKDQLKNKKDCPENKKD